MEFYTNYRTVRTVMMKDKEIGLYIHVPFCKSKCNYCDFNSYAGMEELIPEYFNSMKKEIEFYRERLRDYTIGTVFIGGGTPSMVEEKYIVDILDICFKTMKISNEAEISIEANPGTVNLNKLFSYRNAGINRLSMGLQAWQDHILQYIGRIHKARDFSDNIEAARKAGFENINADLMFGLPGQTINDWEETLKAVDDLGVEHISCYSLKIEEGTVLGEKLDSGELIPVEDELDRAMYDSAIEFLKSKKFMRYEISNFAKPGFQCRHNLIYWRAEEYIGLGAGAHSYFENNRFNNVNKIKDYIRNIQEGNGIIENVQFINLEESMSEYMILGLRLTEGVNIAKFKERFGQNIFDVWGEVIEKNVRKGLLTMENESIQLTSKGFDLANSVFVEFI